MQRSCKKTAASSQNSTSTSSTQAVDYVQQGAAGREQNAAASGAHGDISAVSGPRLSGELPDFLVGGPMCRCRRQASGGDCAADATAAVHSAQLCSDLPGPFVSTAVRGIRPEAYSTHKVGRSLALGFGKFRRLRNVLIPPE